MQTILEGIFRFRQNVFPQQKSLFQTLAQGQQPQALMVTCSDSRIDPSLLTQTAPGELFVLRNAGNIVPPYGAVDGGESATIEYAVGVLGIGHIIICGHSYCGAMAGLLDEASTSNLPAVRSWLQHAESTRKIVMANQDDDSPFDTKLSAAVEANVLVQLEHLRTHPTVRDRASKEGIVLHGWVYKFETGQVDCFNSATNEFVPFECDPLDCSTAADD